MTESEALRILHLEAGCSAADVRQAYIDLAKVWHPDRFDGDGRLRARAERQLKDITEAYAVLQSGAAEEPRPSSPTASDHQRAAEPPASESDWPPAAHTHDSPAPARQFSLAKTIVMGIGLGLVVAAAVTVGMMATRGTQLASTDTEPETATSSTPGTSSGRGAPAEHAAVAGRPRLTSGTELLPPLRSGGGSLVVTNTSGRDAVVALATEAGHERAVYVRAGEQVTLVNVATGTYRVQIMVGRDWDGDRFHGDVGYEELEQPVQFVEHTDRDTTEYTKLTVSLQPVVAGASGIHPTAPFRITPQ
jgi:DnaJ domain